MGKAPYETAACMTKSSSFYENDIDCLLDRSNYHLLALGSMIGTGIYVLPDVIVSTWQDAISRSGVAVWLIAWSFSSCLLGCILVALSELSTVMPYHQKRLDYHYRSWIKDSDLWPRPRVFRYPFQIHRAFDIIELSIILGAITYILLWLICGLGKYAETAYFQELIKGVPVQTLMAYMIVGAFLTVISEIFSMSFLSYSTSTKDSPVLCPERRLGSALVSSMKVAVLSLMALTLVPLWFGATSSFLSAMQTSISSNPRFTLWSHFDFNENIGSLYKPMMRSATSMQGQHLPVPGLDRDFWACINGDVGSERLGELYWSEPSASVDIDLWARIIYDTQKHRLLSSITKKKKFQSRWTSIIGVDGSSAEVLNQFGILQSTGKLLDGYEASNSNLFSATPLSKSTSSCVSSLPSKSQLADGRLETTYIDSTTEAKPSTAATKMKLPSQKSSFPPQKSSFSPYNERTSESSEIQESSQQSYTTVKPNTRLLFKYKLASVTKSRREDTSTQEYLNYIQGKPKISTPISSSVCMVNCETMSAFLEEASSLTPK